MKIEDYLKATQYKITGGETFNWTTFGPDARYLDCDKEDHYSTNIIFDSVTFDVYMCEMWDYVNEREYRWISPEYLDRYKAECVLKDVDFTAACDRTFTDLEVEDDILEKIAGMVSGQEYDTRVKVPIDFSDEELLKYMVLAHERDMTFNEFIEEALRHAIDEFNRDPEGLKQRAKAWAD
jgi:hypothetical protein